MDNRFRSVALSTAQVQEAQSCLQLLRSRREVFRLGDNPIRLLVDGDPHLQFHPSASLQTAFTIPSNSGFLELRGDDDHGDLLIAAFIVPEFLTRFIDRVAFPHMSGGMMEIAISWLGKAKYAQRSCHLCTSMVGDCLR